MSTTDIITEETDVIEEVEPELEEYMEEPEEEPEKPTQEPPENADVPAEDAESPADETNAAEGEEEDDYLAQFTATTEEPLEPEPVYGNCEGPNAAYLKLMSSDRHSFIIKRELALLSPTITTMLSGPGRFNEGEVNVINLNSTPSHLLERICQYFQYKWYYTKNPREIPKFVVEPEIALELLMAANFLDC